jgi:hypothetical protein
LPASSAPTTIIRITIQLLLLRYRPRAPRKRKELKMRRGKRRTERRL